MPRGPRIDAPGLLHHVIARGIERRVIFSDDGEREFFLERLGEIIEDTNTSCYAWCLMTNHFHLLLRTVSVSMATFMRRLMTSYAISYNLWHKRSGHLFQNRYKSIVCEEEPYLLELVRYIHLNPIRSGMVKTINELDDYPWSGHKVLLSRMKKKWQEVNEILSQFGERKRQAQERYRNFIEDGINQRRQTDISGGGLIRSAGGIKEVIERRNAGMSQRYDERILGSGDFVESILKRLERNEEEKDRIKRERIKFEQLLQLVAKEYKLNPEEVISSGRRKLISEARSALSYLCVKYLGLSITEVSKRLLLTQPAISMAFRKGEHIIKTKPWLKDNLCNL